MAVKTKSKTPKLTKGVKYRAYCVKCRKTGRTIKEPHLVEKKNRVMIQGLHKKCGTKMSVMTSANKLEEMRKAAK